jgi:hypothetical protein
VDVDVVFVTTMLDRDTQQRIGSEHRHQGMIALGAVHRTIVQEQPPRGIGAKPRPSTEVGRSADAIAANASSAGQLVVIHPKRPRDMPMTHHRGPEDHYLILRHSQER